MPMMKKGLLRPLRYLSQIFFVTEGRETELQIGYPTDVKHVGHIGLDSTEEKPSWMKEYHSAPLPTGTDGSDSPAGNIWASADMAFVGGFEESRFSARSNSASVARTMTGSPYMSPETSPFGQHEKVESLGIAKKGRKYKKKEAVNAPTDSVSGQELPAVPKKSRRRKQKESEANQCALGPSRLKECSTDATTDKEIEQMLQPQPMKPLVISS
ncbi:Crib domain-containing protein ric3 [Rhynchospora pubera]|uniref:Crib domain-containing protein ric3 n=1 Tax=Rhynchospora pubera TaxID=906938 RepID=A0AAV8F2D0_9POAL|nr:Crib domain-containing protein ric3 [Rhynchospora pubera]